MTLSKKALLSVMERKLGTKLHDFTIEEETLMDSLVEAINGELSHHIEVHWEEDIEPEVD